MFLSVALTDIPNDYQSFKDQELLNKIVLYYTEIVLELSDRFFYILLLSQELSGVLLSASIAALVITYIARVIVAGRFWSRVNDGMIDATDKWNWTADDGDAKDKKLVYVKAQDKRLVFPMAVSVYVLLPTVGTPIIRGTLRDEDAGAFGWKRLETATNALNDGAMATGSIIEGISRLCTESLLAIIIEVAAVLVDPRLVTKSGWILSFLTSVLHAAKVLLETVFDMRYVDKLKQKGRDADKQFDKNTTDDAAVAKWAATAGPLARRVTLSYCNDVTGKGIAELARHCSGLTEVYLSFCTLIDDSAIELLMDQCPGIQEMWLDGCAVTARVVQKLREKNVVVSANHL